jgi:3-phenylpropionate/cinnamic acid dioxygenase small subunit
MALSDGDHLRNLLGRYCERVDAGDWDGVGALFSDGQLATEDGTVLASGADAVAAFYRGITHLHDGSPRTKHLVADVVIDLEDGDRAVVRSSYLVLQAVDGVLALRPIVAGRYVDTFHRAADRGDGGWVWRERRFTVDLTGDLSSHLRITL